MIFFYLEKKKSKLVSSPNKKPIVILEIPENKKFGQPSMTTKNQIIPKQLVNNSKTFVLFYFLPLLQQLYIKSQ
jgi:hypothetical protein